ncbi:hypothetical protein L6258_00805, partial [Candidatus Parcubacteria bacterium]|nr:hypothetical protein [Candidatus Parcubacteria bacterium]
MNPTINPTKNWLFRRWPGLVLIILATLPLLWFKGNYLLSFEENFYLNYTFVFEKYRDLWSSHLNNGYTHFFYPALFPQAIFWKVLSSIGTPPVLIQKSFFVAAFGLVAFSFYQFLSVFTNNKLIRITSTCLYLLNFYVFSSIFYTAKVFQLFLMPGAFFLTYRYLTTKKTLYLFSNSLLIYIFQGLFCNLPQALSTLLVYPTAFGYFTLIKKPNLKKSLVRFALYLTPVALVGILNLWIYSINFSPEEIESSLAGNTFEALKTNLFKIIQLRGAWWENAQHADVPYNQLANFYENPVIVLASILIFSTSLIPLITKKTTKSHLFWLGTLLIALSLATGTGFPGGAVFSFLYNRITYFRIFREPWAKFMPWVVFSTATASAIALNSLAKSHPALSKKIPLLVLAL